MAIGSQDSFSPSFSQEGTGRTGETHWIFPMTESVRSLQTLV